MRGSWYLEFVHIHVFMEIHETINNNPLNCFEFHPHNYKNMAFKSIQPETCFGKLWGRMTQPVKRFDRAMRYIYTISNLECCKCARMRFHCANALVVLRISAP